MVNNQHPTSWQPLSHLSAKRTVIAVAVPGLQHDISLKQSEARHTLISFINAKGYDKRPPNFGLGLEKSSKNCWKHTSIPVTVRIPCMTFLYIFDWKHTRPHILLFSCRLQPFFILQFLLGGQPAVHPPC